MSAAHFKLPTNTTLNVLTFGPNVVEIKVKINDEVPKIKGTILEISEEAAEKLGIKNEGIFSCVIEVPQQLKFSWGFSSKWIKYKEIFYIAKKTLQWICNIWYFVLTCFKLYYFIL